MALGDQLTDGIESQLIVILNDTRHLKAFNRTVHQYQREMLGDHLGDLGRIVGRNAHEGHGGNQDETIDTAVHHRVNTLTLPVLIKTASGDHQGIAFRVQNRFQPPDKAAHERLDSNTSGKTAPMTPLWRLFSAEAK